MNYKISVVTVCYNAEKEIERTATSVLSQNFDNYNYYIIDGNSTDRTVKIAKDISSNYSLKQVIVSEPDEGIYNAMNKAIDMVDGEWIIFMNAGDQFYDDNVLREFSSFGNKADFVYGDSCYINRGGSFMVKAGELEQIRDKMPFCHQAMFNKTEVLRKLRFDESYKVCADYDCYQRAFKEGISFEHIPICVCRYEEGGVSAKAWDRSNREIRDIQIKNGITKLPRLKYIVRSIRGAIGRLTRKCIPESKLNKIRQKKYGEVLK